MIKQRIGVLGGGQLGKMLFQSSLDLDLDLHFLDADPQAPCAGFTKNFTEGSLKDYNTVLAFGADKDLITIEIENVNLEALSNLEKQGKLVFPQPSVLKMIQDKRNQKAFFVEHNIPTAEYILVENASEVVENLAFLPAVNKLAKDGYDGKGVTILKSAADIDKAFDKPGLLEKLIPFTKEIAVMVARSANGETAVYPTVEMVFEPEANLVDYLLSPAQISPEIDQKAKEIASKIVQALGIVGCLAIEMFLLENGDILVNEIAPRVHNSGHQTQRGCLTSQFEQHLRAISGLPLGPTEAYAPSALVNLLGHPDHSGPVHYEGMEEILAMPGVHPFLYGKAITKPFRKMGHITIVDKNFENLIKKTNFVKETIRVVSKNN